MSPMMLLFFCFVGINSAVIVDKVDGTLNGYKGNGYKGNGYIGNGYNGNNLNGYNGNGYNGNNGNGYNGNSYNGNNLNGYNGNGYNGNNGNGNGWQVFRMFHPPSAQSIVKYETNAYPKYEFEYAVSDRRTGDHKHHYETRDGNRVRGEYGLVEADGSLRKVQYNADDFNGFNAVVSNTVNRHGDSAISVSGQTRQFAPITQSVKINHFFPSKDAQYQGPTNGAQDIVVSTPVQDGTVDSTIIQQQSDENSDIPEGRERLVVPEADPDQKSYADFQGNNQNVNFDASLVNADAADGSSYTVSPSALPILNEQTASVDTEVNSGHVIVPETDRSAGYPQQENGRINEEERAHKDDPHNTDSDVASSYYHSKVYYNVGY